MSQENLFKESEILLSTTDLDSKIKYANDDFCKIAGYSVEELQGNPHNMVRHPDMPKAAFKDLWTTVQNGKVWKGYVKNATKSGGYYWVYATVYPFKNKQGHQCYLSCRRIAPRDMIEKYSSLYKTMS